MKTFIILATLFSFSFLQAAESKTIDSKAAVKSKPATKRGPASYGKIPKCDEGTAREPFVAYFVTYELGKNGYGRTSNELARFLSALDNKSLTHYSTDHFMIQEIKGDYGTEIKLGATLPIDNEVKVKSKAFKDALTRLSVLDGVGISCDYLSAE